jgi:hypothetical protein
MIDYDDIVFCEHGHDPDECPVCAPVERETAYLERLRLVEIPPELQGVPFG